MCLSLRPYILNPFFGSVIGSRWLRQCGQRHLDKSTFSIALGPQEEEGEKEEERGRRLF